MQKYKPAKRDILLVKLFFVLAVLAVGIITLGSYWYIQPTTPEEKNQGGFVPMAEQTVPAVSTNPVQISVPSSREVSVCDITLTLPDIALFSLVKNEDENMLQPGYCSYVSDPTRRFRILIIDTALATSTYEQERREAFLRYVKTGSAEEIKTIATSDLFSTGIRSRRLYTTISPASIGYTAEIFQDFPGRGVYQTATYLRSRYIVYLTYGLFENVESDWNLYFNKNYRAEIDTDNYAELFKNYMGRYSSRPEIKVLIDEINASTKTVKAVN